MDKKLESIIKKIKNLDSNYLAESDDNTLEKVKNVLGDNIPTQLLDWYSLFNGGSFGSGLEFCSTNKRQKGFEWGFTTLREVNTKSYKKMDDIPDDLIIFAIENTGDPVGFKRDGGEAIYSYYREGFDTVEYKDLTEYLENELSLLFLMEDAFDRYFEKLIDVYNYSYDTNPFSLYSDALNKKLVLSEPDNDGYVEWKPVRQPARVSTKKIEKKMGFPLKYSLKDYYTTYYFCELVGKVGRKELDFFPITDKDIETVIEQQYNAGQALFPNSEIFVLGRAFVSDNDNYSICYNNSNDKLFLFDAKTRKKIKLDPLTYVIATMDPLIN